MRLQEEPQAPMGPPLLAHVGAVANCRFEAACSFEEGDSSKFALQVGALAMREFESGGVFEGESALRFETQVGALAVFGFEAADGV